MRNYEPSVAFVISLVATLLGGGAITIAPYAAIPEPVSAADNKTLVYSDNVPGGVAFRGETDFHPIPVGYQETCSLETWELPLKYRSVGEFVAEHPDAQPDRVEPANNPDDWNLCSSNEMLQGLSPEDQWVSTHEGLTGLKAIMEANDSLT